jgi:sigma-B regulation protein RsbU (phosphoserine phosphatase)
MFATAVYGVVDAARGTLRISCAGHPPPLAIRPGDGVSPLTVESVMPLLWQELGEIPCAEHALGHGDRAAFYTDGITDRHAADDTMYDPERLTSALAASGALPPAAIIEHLVADLDAFAGGHEPDDDQTLLIVGVDIDATLAGPHEDTK